MDREKAALETAKSMELAATAAAERTEAAAKFVGHGARGEHRKVSTPEIHGDPQRFPEIPGILGNPRSL